MDKPTLLASQPIVSKVLSHALIHQRLSHAYLFVGSKGTPKKEMAILLAQSLICSHPDAQGFACGCCDACQRIATNRYSDMVMIDPYAQYEQLKLAQSTSKRKKKDGSTKPKPISIPRISKEQIASLQSFFSTTPLERAGWKIYIINGIERMSEEASNALLKFLEEPHGDKVCAILIADSTNGVLPTIISRCQLIRFKAVSHQTIQDKVAQEGGDDLLALMASYLWRGETIESFNNSKDVLDALGVVMQLVRCNNHQFRFKAIEIENDVILSTGFTKECGKYIFDMFYIIMMLYYQDPSSFPDLTIALKPKNITKFLLILTQASSKCDGTYYFPLVYEQTISYLAEEL